MEKKSSRLRRKLVRNLRDVGVLCTARKGLVCLFSPFYLHKVYRIYSIRLDQGAQPVPPRDDFEFRFITVNDSRLIQQIEVQEEWLAGKIESKLESGAICLVALDGETVAGFNVVSFGEVYIPFIRMKRRFRPNEAWSDQVTVSYLYRGRGLGVSLRLRIFEELRLRGIRRLIGGTLPNNHANLALCRKVGLQEVANAHYVRQFGRERWYFKRVRPDQGCV